MRVFLWLLAAFVAWMAMFTFALGAALGGSGSLPLSAPVGAVAGIPTEALALYKQAGEKYKIDWTIIAAIYFIESDHGRSTAAGVHSGVNFAGCCAGPGQFSITPRPSTWDFYGNGGDVYSMDDAVPATARYLKASGAPGDYHSAIWAYNHSNVYVQNVLDKALEYRSAATAPADGVSDIAIPGGSMWLADIPGSPGVRCDTRIVADVAELIDRYHLHAGDCYATSGHASSGEHPLGLGIDLTPGPGGSWDDIDALAAWAEPSQNNPRRPFRWVGYNGDANHGRGNHLHLSWSHSGRSGPPAGSVSVFSRP